MTGTSREAHKRQKRPNRGFGGNEETEMKLSKIRRNLGFETEHVVRFLIINYWDTFWHQIIQVITKNN